MATARYDGNQKWKTFGLREAPFMRRRFARLKMIARKQTSCAFAAYNFGVFPFLTPAKPRYTRTHKSALNLNYSLAPLQSFIPHLLLLHQRLQAGSRQSGGGGKSPPRICSPKLGTARLKHLHRPTHPYGPIHCSSPKPEHREKAGELKEN